MVYVAENDLELELWQKMTTYRAQREALSGSIQNTGFGATIASLARGSKNAQLGLRVGLRNAL